jgi:hypothetical protein
LRYRTDSEFLMTHAYNITPVQNPESGGEFATGVHSGGGAAHPFTLRAAHPFTLRAWRLPGSGDWPVATRTHSS